MSNIEIKILQSNWHKSNKFYTGQIQNNNNDCDFHMLVNMSLMIQYFGRTVASPHWDNDSNKVDQLTLNNHNFNELMNNSALTLRLELE